MRAHTLFSHPSLTEYVASERSNKKNKFFPCETETNIVKQGWAKLSQTTSPVINTQNPLLSTSPVWRFSCYVRIQPSERSSFDLWALGVLATFGAPYRRSVEQPTLASEPERDFLNLIKSLLLWKVLSTLNPECDTGKENTFHQCCQLPQREKGNIAAIVVRHCFRLGLFTEHLRWVWIIFTGGSGLK